MNKPSIQFDEHGRLIPLGLTCKANLESRRYFKVNKTASTLEEIYDRTTRYLGPCDDLSLTDFKTKVAELVAVFDADELLRPLIQSAPVPFILPKGTISMDVRMSMSPYLAAVAQSFQEKFPDARFTDHSIQKWKDEFSVAPESRAQSFLVRCQDESVVGLFMPALSEFSVPAAYEAIERMPDRVSLAGVFELAGILVGTPQYLVNESAYSPLLWATSNINKSSPNGFHFASYGRDMTFNCRPHLNEVSEYWVNGLVVS